MRYCENCHDLEKCEMYGGCWNPPAKEKPLSPSDATACSPSSLTPETDAMVAADQHHLEDDNFFPATVYWRMCDLARTLERERDEWRGKAVDLHKVKTAAYDALIAAGDMIYRIARTNDDYIAAEHFKMGAGPHENGKGEWVSSEDYRKMEHERDMARATANTFRQCAELTFGPMPFPRKFHWENVKVSVPARKEGE